MLPDQTSLPMFNLFGFVLTALAAGWTDLRSWRIPNRLLAPAAAGALMLAAFLPAGIGLTDGLLGALLGLGLL